MKWSTVVALLLVCWLSASGFVARAQSQACAFERFAGLREAIAPALVGDCLSSEITNDNGDVQQQTSRGVLVWRASDGSSAFSDGNRSWIAGPNGVQTRLNDQRFSWEPDADGFPSADTSNLSPLSGSAEEAVLALRARGLPLGDYVVYTAETDTNNLLGRPNGYTSKVNFRDARLKTQRSSDFDTDDGGSIEVFTGPLSAEKRCDYIQGIGQSLPMLTEYDYVQGGMLLRLSKRLTPAQAAQYEAALHGQPLPPIPLPANPPPVGPRPSIQAAPQAAIPSPSPIPSRNTPISSQTVDLTSLLPPGSKVERQEVGDLDGDGSPEAVVLATADDARGARRGIFIVATNPASNGWTKIYDDSTDFWMAGGFFLANVTGDTRRQAVLFRSEGNAGLLSYKVLGFDGQNISVLFDRDGIYAGSVRTANGVILERSSERTTILSWDGSTFNGTRVPDSPLADAVVVRYRITSTKAEGPPSVTLKVGQRLQLIRDDDLNDSVRLMGSANDPFRWESSLADATVATATAAGQTEITIIPRAYDWDLALKLKVVVQP